MQSALASLLLQQHQLYKNYSANHLEMHTKAETVVSVH